MIRASEYAARLKRLFQKLRRQHGKPDASDPTDPVQQLLIAVLSKDTTDAKARKGLASLEAFSVDVNDLRVTTVADMVEALGSDYPDGMARVRAIKSMLSDLFNRENVLTLEFLRDRGRREARQYLESLEGVDGYAAASVMLWSLGGHAIPLDGPMLEVLQHEEVINPESSLAEAQAFVERHIHAADAQVFTAVLRRAAAGRARSAAKAAAPASRKKRASTSKKAKKKTTAAKARRKSTRSARPSSRASGSRSRGSAAGKRRKRATSRKTS